MGQRKRVIGRCAVLAVFLVMVGCGSGGTTPSTAVSINALDGQTGIPVDSTFQYNFAQLMNKSSVTAGDFFIVPAAVPAAQTVKAAYDPAACDATHALAALISCDSPYSCTLDPEADLEGNTLYSICLSPEILMSTGQSFDGFLASFTTGGGNVPAAILQLIRLDGTKMELTAKPIPLRVGIEATFATAIEDTAAVEAMMHVTDDKGTAVTGTYAWNTEKTVLTFAPSTNLRYRTTYTVAFTAPASGASTMASDASRTFTTMTEGDVNGDGVSDILVSSENLSQPPIMSRGAVYVFDGATLSAATTVNNALAAIFGEDNTALGWDVAMAGDVNGDGYADVMFSTIYGCHGAMLNTGIVYIFSGRDLGPSSTLANALAVIYGAADGDTFGFGLAGLGDINNDGYGDVSATAITGNDNWRGDAYFFSGKELQPTMTANQALAKLSGVANSDSFGYSISGIGDANGDGADDFIVGAYGVTVGGQTSAGQAYLFSGAGISAASTTANAFATIVRDTPVADDYLGDSVSGAGDVNGDGIPDIIVGADCDNSCPGYAFVFSGATLTGAMTTVSSLATITGAANDDYFGYPVTGVGDVNGDGLDDIGIGACCTGGDRGAAYVFSGASLSGALGTGAALAAINGANAGDYLARIGGAGDVNGDGKPDIIVGASNYNAGTGQGIAYIFNGLTLGPATTVTDALTGILGESAGASMGYRVGSVHR